MFGLIVPVFIPELSLLNDIKYLLISALVMFFIRKSGKLDAFHIGFILILIVNILGSFFATNKSIALHYNLIYLLFLAFSYVIVSVDFIDKNIHLISKSLEYIYYSLLFLLVLLGIFPNFTFSYNLNYLATILLMLFPFAWFSNRITPLVKIFQLLSLGFVLYFSGVQGSLLIFVVLILFFLVQEFQLAKLLPIFALILIFYLFKSNFYEDDARQYLLIKSWDIFLENPLVGVGSGNFFFHAHQGSTTDLNFLSNPNYLVRYVHPHNIIAQIFCENGLLSGILFLVILTRNFINSFNILNFSNFFKCCFYSTSIYILLSFFYGSIFVDLSHFSSTFLIFLVFSFYLNEKTF